MSNKRMFIWEQAASLRDKYKHTQVVLLLMQMAAAYRLLHYQYELRVPCSQGMCTARHSAEGKHQNTTLHTKGLHLLRQAFTWSIKSLEDDGSPDRITTGLPETLLPLAAVFTIHDINVSNAQMVDSTLPASQSLQPNFQHIPAVFHYEDNILHKCKYIAMNWAKNRTMSRLYPSFLPTAVNFLQIMSCLPYTHD